jgi:hypothetical protein
MGSVITLGMIAWSVACSDILEVRETSNIVKAAMGNCCCASRLRWRRERRWRVGPKIERGRDNSGFGLSFWGCTGSYRRG